MALTADADRNILGLPFYKESTESAVLEFEKLMLYGLVQTLNWFTDLTFTEHNLVPSHLRALHQLPGDIKISELKLLGKQHGCRYMLCGTMEPEIGPSGYLDGIQLDIQLLDLRRKTYVLQLNYYFTSFDTPKPMLSSFSPTLDGMQHLVKWLSAQMCGAISPESALKHWEKIQSSAFAYNLRQYQTLARAHFYHGGEEELSQRLLMLTQMTLDEPNLFLAQWELGMLHKRLKNYPFAITALEQAFKLMRPVTPRRLALCATELGVCYALCQSDEKAATWWQTAIQEDPTYVNPYMNLAHSMEEQGRTSEAEHYFVKACEIAPDDPRIYFNLARIYSKMEQWEKAIFQYEQQLVLEPPDAWATSNLANCYLQKGDIHHAKTYLEKTVELDPDGEAGRVANMILSGLQAAET